MSDIAQRDADDREYRDAFMAALGVVLWRHRAARGLTQAQVAGQIGLVGSAAIGHHEHGARNIPIPTLLRYARFYRISLGELMDEASYLVAALPPRHDGDVHLATMAASRIAALAPLRAWAAVQLDTLAVSPGATLRLDDATVPPLAHLCGMTPADLVATLTGIDAEALGATR